MVVGVCQLRMIINGVSSLKEKRGVARRIIARVKNKFPVSIAEVEDNDLWKSLVIGFCMVGNDRSFVNSWLDKTIDFIENLYLAEIVDRRIEIMNINS
jgi:uncharacterized protein YlxP (DUF503 family)